MESVGTALGSVWGGPQKTRYFTPSGEEVWAIPALREWVRKGADGKIVASGERDANLDKGWSLIPPAVLKLHCSGCDRYHDTEEEVRGCKDAKATFAKEWEDRARQMTGQNGAGETGEVAALTSKVEELTALVEKLLEGRG